MKDAEYLQLWNDSSGSALRSLYCLFMQILVCQMLRSAEWLLSGSCGCSAPPNNWHVNSSLDFAYGKNKTSHQSCTVCFPPHFMSWPGENSWCLLKTPSDVTRHHRGKHKSKCKYSALSQHWPNVINEIWGKHFSYSLLLLGTQRVGTCYFR